MKYPAFLLLIAFSALIPARVVEATPANHPMPIVEVVSTTRDSGRGSLRAAIEKANRNAKTRIVFRIPATDAGFSRTERQWTIAPASPLPALQKPDTRLECDGPVVVSGQNAGASGSGLRIEAVRCSVSGLQWANWSQEAIAIRSSRALIRGNGFRDSGVGIIVVGAKSRGNRFARNTFQDVATPIALRNGANAGVTSPTLTVVRQDALGEMAYLFTIRFQGKPNSKVTLELDHSPDEAREMPRVNAVESIVTVNVDSHGIAEWQFNRTGYPVGSWTVLATQDGNTSAYSNTVVMPYLQ